MHDPRAAIQLCSSGTSTSDLPVVCNLLLAHEPSALEMEEQDSMVSDRVNFGELSRALNMPACAFVWSCDINWVKNQTKSFTEHNQLNHNSLDKGGCLIEETEVQQK